MGSFTVFKGSKDGLPKKDTMLKPGELVSDLVLVRVTASGLCGTGKHIIRKPFTRVPANDTSQICTMLVNQLLQGSSPISENRN